MTDVNIFTHIHCLKRTKKQIELLASVANAGEGVNMYDLVGSWANTAWEEAKEAGLVTEAMLPISAHWVGKSPVIDTAKKRSTQRAGVKAV